MNVIRISTHGILGTPYTREAVWTATVYMGGRIETRAVSYDEGAAIADAVAKFRMARYDRVTSAKTR